MSKKLYNQMKSYSEYMDSLHNSSMAQQLKNTVKEHNDNTNPNTNPKPINIWIINTKLKKIEDEFWDNQHSNIYKYSETKLKELDKKVFNLKRDFLISKINEYLELGLEEETLKRLKERYKI